MFSGGLCRTVLNLHKLCLDHRSIAQETRNKRVPDGDNPHPAVGVDVASWFRSAYLVCVMKKESMMLIIFRMLMFEGAPNLVLPT